MIKIHRSLLARLPSGARLWVMPKGRLRQLAARPGTFASLLFQKRRLHWGWSHKGRAASLASCAGYVGAALMLTLSQASEAAQPAKYVGKVALPTRAFRSADHFLREIYAHYRPQNSTSKAAGASPWERRLGFFTPRTIAVIDTHQKLLTEVGAVDGDPFCGCQEWTTLSVERVRTKAAGADRSEATVKFHDEDGTSREVAFRLQRLDGSWRVDDMTLLGASPDGWLVETLQAEAEGLRTKIASEER